MLSSNLHGCFREDKSACEIFMAKRLVLSHAKGSYDHLGQVDRKRYGLGINCLQHIVLFSDYLLFKWEVIDT